jgi:hypothetical protein
VIVERSSFSKEILALVRDSSSDALSAADGDLDIGIVGDSGQLSALAVVPATDSLSASKIFMSDEPPIYQALFSLVWELSSPEGISSIIAEGTKDYSCPDPHRTYYNAL